MENQESVLNATGSIKNLHIEDNEEEEKMGPKWFKTIKVLGRGGFGKVYLVQKTIGEKKEEVFAMKVIQKDRLVSDRKELEHTKTERHVLENVSSPFLVSLCFAFQSREKLYFVMDFFGGGDLFSHLSREEKFSVKMTRFYLSEIALGIEHLHDKNVVYRDLKPDNVLIGKDGHIKLTDFGLCKDIGESQTKTFCGTIEYMAPEIFACKGHGKPVDFWSLGVLAYDMLTGEPLFVGKNKREQEKAIRKNPIVLPETFTQATKELLERLLERKPEKRMGIEELKGSNFFKGVDWKKTLAQKVEPPFKPEVKNKFDVRQFDENFTELPITETPSKECDSDEFVGFDFCVESTSKARKRLDFSALSEVPTQEKDADADATIVAEKEDPEVQSKLLKAALASLREALPKCPMPTSASAASRLARYHLAGERTTRPIGASTSPVTEGEMDNTLTESDSFADSQEGFEILENAEICASKDIKVTA